jgi:hypothetical protein
MSAIGDVPCLEGAGRGPKQTKTGSKSRCRRAPDLKLANLVCCLSRQGQQMHFNGLNRREFIAASRRRDQVAVRGGHTAMA